MEEMVMTLGRGRAAVFCQTGQPEIRHRLRQEKRAAQVDRDQAVKALLRGFQQVFALGGRHARIVHQKVNPAEAVDHGFQQLLAVARSGNIAREYFKGGPGTCRRLPPGTVAGIPPPHRDSKRS